MRTLTAAVFAALAAGCSGKSAPTYETATVDKGRIAPKVTATGTVSATVTVQVGSQVSGRVAALYADFNTSVDAGQTIAKIDPQLFEAELEQARANHMAAQGNLARSQVQAADAERQFQRTKSLAERNLVALAELDTARATMEAAKAQVDVSRGNVAQSKAALHQAEVNLTYTTILSPISGTVISRNVDVGQTVAASLSAPTLFVIAEDLRKMQVDTAVAEADVGKLQPGMDATFVVDAFPGDRFRGKVRQIRNAPQTVQNVVTYDAVIDVDNPELKLRPGMTANVTFIWAQRDDVLRVPNAALRFRPPPDVVKKKAPADGEKKERRERGPSDEKTVWLMKGEELEPRKVKVGITDGSVTEVLAGLSEGDVVVTESNDPSAQGGGQQRQRGGQMGGGGMRRLF